MQKLPVYTFTKEGYEHIKKEYEELSQKRPMAVEDLSKARALGDLKENGYYKAARMKLSSIDHRLRQLKLFITYGKVIESPGNEFVSIGNTVTVSDGKREKTFTIVGSYEANPSENKLSDKSPIGRALIGKKVSHTTEVVTPSGTLTYTILKII